jgi:hypothetical protein
MKKLGLVICMVVLATVFAGCSSGTILTDAAHDYYATGQFANWGDAAGNADFKMDAIALNDKRVSSIKKQLKGATGLYVKEIELPAAAAGWDVTYKINGTETKLDGNLTVKVIQTATGDNVPSFWAQSPESGEIKNLTADTIYVPPFVEANVDQAGTWNDNPAALKAGKYDLVFVTFEGSKAMALIAK